MRRFLLLLPLLAAAVMFGFAGGCSSDDGPTGGGTPLGDTTAPEFQFVDSVMGEGSFDMLDKGMKLSFALLDSIPGVKVAGRTPPRLSASTAAQLTCEYWDSLSFTYTYDSASGWHEFNFDAVLVDTCNGDTFSLSGYDSIRVTSNGIPMPTPDVTADAVSIRNSLEAKKQSSTDSISATQSFDITGNALTDSAIIVINGSADEEAHMLVSDADATCDLALSNSMLITAIQTVAGNDECPQLGTVTMTSTVNLACQGQGNSPLDSLNINGTWTLTARFNNGMQTMTYTDGTTTWTVTDDCGGSFDPGPGDSSFVSDFMDGDQILNGPFGSSEIAFALLDSIPGATPSGAGDHILVDTIIYYSYNSLTGWHIFHFQATIFDTSYNMEMMDVDTIDISGWDSVQTLVDNVPVEFPDSTMNGLNIRAHGNWNSQSSTDNGAQHHNVEFDLVVTGPDSILQVLGSAHDTLHVSDEGIHGLCDVSLTIDQVISNFSMNIGDTASECPISGSIIANARLDASCTGGGPSGTDLLEVHGNWSVQVFVEADSSLSISFDDGTTYWSVNEPCIGMGGMASRQPSWPSFQD